MSVRLGLLALIMATSLICAPQAFAQDAGVSGIPSASEQPGGSIFCKHAGHPLKSRTSSTIIRTGCRRCSQRK